MPTSRGALMGTQGFHGRAAKRYADEWLDAINAARDLPENLLPPVANRSDGPPQVRSWVDRDPVAAGRLAKARRTITELSEELNVPLENLLTPDYMRRVLWTPPEPAEGQDMEAAVGAELSRLSARSWQIGLTAPLIADAILNPDDITASE